MAWAIRIFMVISIIAGIASMVAGLKLKSRIADQATNIQVATEKADGLSKELDKQKKDLEEAANKTKAAESKVTDAQAEINKGKAELENQLKKIKEVEDERTKIAAERDEKQVELQNMVKALPDGITPEQLQTKLKDVQEQLTNLTQEKKILDEQLLKANQEVKKYAELQKATQEGKLPSGLAGHVLAVNDDWNFVVLDIGSNHRVVENAAMIVYRAGKVVGKVRITSVEPSISIADILTDWKKGKIQEGDQVQF